MSGMPTPHCKFQTLFNLESLAAEGSGATQAERKLAAHKAAALRVKLKHASPPAKAVGLDLLAWSPKSSPEARVLVKFGPARTRVFDVARDIARASLGIAINLRHARDGQSEFVACIDENSARALSQSLGDLTTKIEGFWETYLEKDPRRVPADGLAFFAGLADGFLGDGRPSGIVPGRSIFRKSSKRKIKKFTGSRAFSLHPYEVGHAAGSMARFKIELPRIHAFLGSAAQMLPGG
jgi:hypothetical protein